MGQGLKNVGGHLWRHKWFYGIILVCLAWPLLSHYLRSDSHALPTGAKPPQVGSVIKISEETKGVVRSTPWGSPEVTLDIYGLDVWLEETGIKHGLLVREANVQEADLRAYAAKQTSSSEEEKAALTVTEKKVSQWVNVTKRKLALTIGRFSFDALVPVHISSKAGETESKTEATTHLTYSLERPERDAGKWQELVRATGLITKLPISVALKDGQDYFVLPTFINGQDGEYYQEYDLILRSVGQRTLAWASFGLMAALMFHIMIRTDMLRDPRDSRLAENEKSPWSISRMIFALWLAVCTASFIYIWAMTDSVKSFSDTALTLMGLQGGTLLVAATLGRREPDPSSLSGPGGVVPKSRGFAADLLDEGGPSELSRMQMIIWNVLLSFVFLWQTLTKWQMASFDSNLLVLLGISNATYVGFKLAEKPATQTAPSGASGTSPAIPPSKPATSTNP